ncbi:hypothetical protein IV203_036041 [Nitzschia inconspicua]|uniref:Uncharacterized protein n=1 Tax=Nitzschia inconspicua TaxID=303405 RepID=A0A9K3PV62_9STRA|nr:hypothetical protein IV203_036041 [Nitzschia inconspicua]
MPGDNETAVDTLVPVVFVNDSDGATTSVEVPDGTKITEAATKAGVYIPTLCHHPRLPPIGKCGLCVISVENGPTPHQLACSTACRLNDDGTPMTIHVNGTVLNSLSNAALRRNMETSTRNLVQKYKQNNQFSPCGSLEIEDLGNWMGNEMVDTSSNCILYDPSLCVGCSRCVRACDQIQGMKVLETPLPPSNIPALGISSLPPCMMTRASRPLKETECIGCGQCTVFCPTGAIREVDHTPRVMRALLDPEKVVVLQTAPSVRVTIAEMFGGKPGDCSDGQLVGAARVCGFQFVFDTNLAADLTIMEEANELLKRMDIAANGTEQEKAESPLPMFTSCCPGWINLVEQSYPELIPHLSTCRSPMSMLSSVIRHHWWPQQAKILGRHGQSNKTGDAADQSKLIVVAVMPCTAKKDEIAREQFRMKNGTQETDAVLTVREFARVMELRGVASRNDYESFRRIPKLVYDNPFGESTGAAVIFGVTGGVMEAALRTAADVLSGKNLSNVKYESVRGLFGIKESTIKLGASDEISLKVAVCHQMRNVREFLTQIEERKEYHFIEVMTCPGGCIGGGGLPQSRDGNILAQRIESVYSLDERMVQRKSHENASVKQLYTDLLSKPLSHTSHRLLHTHYTARPRLPPIILQPSPGESLKLVEDSANTIYVIFGTQSGTAAQAAKEIKTELQQFIGRSRMCPEPTVSLVAGDALPPNSLLKIATSSLASIFVTCTFGEGEFPEQLQKFWESLQDLKSGILKEESFRFAVFGLGSSMYAAADQFNRAAKLLDEKLSDMGADRLIKVGLGDDQSPELYRGELDSWMEALLPKLFSGNGKAGGISLLDPPEPIFRLSMAPGKHRSNFHPLPHNYHFVKLESIESIVSLGYSRPAAIFTFDLKNTGLKYDVGDHLALLPRNPATVVDRVLHLYFPQITGDCLLSVESVDPLGDCPFPAALTARELLTQYLDLCGRPSRSFLRQLFLFATSREARDELRCLFEKDNPNSSDGAFEKYTDTHTFADVLCDFGATCLPPFEYLLSMVPAICPRLYSIASSPLHREDKLDLLVVLNEWKDSKSNNRVGLTTQFLFNAKPEIKVAVQIRRGILQLPDSPESPILMFGLGTGVAPFRGFLQHRQALLRSGVKLGPAALYVGFRHENQDFYLKDEYETWMKEGVLTAVHAAFSHDNILQRGGKLYFISDMIEEKPRDIAEALQLKSDKGSEVIKKPRVHVYYCGPAMGIPETIQNAMKAAISHEEGGGIAEDDAMDFMDRLIRREDRFHTECF